MARFLSLRAEEDASRLGEIFAAHGQEVVLLPLQEIVALPADLPDGPFAAVMATSAHAASWLGAQPSLRGLPALAVGPRTALALRDVGWRDVRVGGGDARTLLPIAREIVNEDHRPILYAAGRVRHPETEAGFAEIGIALRTAEVYDTRLRAPDREEIDGLLRAGPIDGVLVLSVAQAVCLPAFVSRIGAVRLLCLSPRIRDALPPELRTDAETAPAPTLAALAELAASGQEARRMP